MLLIVDGFNLYINCFAANPSMDSNGEHIGGLIGFMTSMNKVVRETKPDRVIVVWDGEGGSVRRRSLYKDYKAGRKPRLNREYEFGDAGGITSFARQLDLLKKYLGMLPLVDVCVAGAEGDDVIACATRMCGDEPCVILSADKDFYQLIDERVAVYTPRKKTVIRTADVVRQFGILPENLVIARAMAGDGSDNIKGIGGVGTKTALKLFPVLGQRAVELHEIIALAEAGMAEGKKQGYAKVCASRDIVSGNVKLMQLTNPEMDPGKFAEARAQLVREPNGYKQVQFQMELLRDGISFQPPSDFHANFKMLAGRASLKKLEESKKNV